MERTQVNIEGKGIQLLEKRLTELYQRMEEANSKTDLVFSGLYVSRDTSDRSLAKVEVMQNRIDSLTLKVVDSLNLCDEIIGKIDELVEVFPTDDETPERR